MTELMIGAGNSRLRQVRMVTEDEELDPDAVTLDIDPNSHPDIIWDLNDRPLPFESDRFDIIHAYSVLEHIGTQGDWRGFFEEFSEYHRILRHDGQLRIICPRPTSPWAWGDPGHTRVLSMETFTFLSQDQYLAQVGKTAMTDYRSVYSGDFLVAHAGNHGEHDMEYVLVARKVSNH